MQIYELSLLLMLIWSQNSYILQGLLYSDLHLKYILLDCSRREEGREKYHRDKNNHVVKPKYYVKCETKFNDFFHPFI